MPGLGHKHIIRERGGCAFTTVHEVCSKLKPRHGGCWARRNASMLGAWPKKPTRGEREVVLAMAVNLRLALSLP